MYTLVTLCRTTKAVDLKCMPSPAPIRQWCDGLNSRHALRQMQQYEWPAEYMLNVRISESHNTSIISYYLVEAI